MTPVPHPSHVPLAQSSPQAHPVPSAAAVAPPPSSPVPSLPPPPPVQAPVAVPPSRLNQDLMDEFAAFLAQRQQQ